MIATVRIAELGAVVIGLVLYGALLWFLKRRFLIKVDRIFDRHSFDKPALAEINGTLDDMNEDSAHFVFTLERFANIPFRERAITVIYGRVGTRSPGGIRGPEWTLRKDVYVLVEKGESEWMERHPHVFKPAMAGYKYSIFWVNLDALASE